MYGSGGSAAGGFVRVSPASWLAGIITEDEKSFAAAGSKSAAGTPSLAAGDVGACGVWAARCFLRHSAERAVPSMTVPCSSLVEVGGVIPVM